MLWYITCLFLLIHHGSFVNAQVTNNALNKRKDGNAAVHAQSDINNVNGKGGSPASQNTSSSTGGDLVYIQRDGRIIKTKEGSTVRTDITNQVSNHPVAEAAGPNPSVNNGMHQNSARTTKDAATIYYVQRDSRVIRTKEGSTNRTDVTDQALNYPTADTRLSSGNSKLKVIDTNVLSQFLPDTTQIGDPKAGVDNAYPWNPIISESPQMKKTSLRPTKSIDQVIEKTYINGVSNYPTKSGQVLTELDMMMTDEQYLFYYMHGKLVPRGKKRRRLKRKALNFEFTYWPKGVIPYTVDNSFSANERKLLLSSMQDWMDKTCVKFTPATSADTDVLTIQNGEGCNSFVGRVGGSQSLNLQSACREYHVMKHELGHVMGLIHEHQRFDRDDYITVASKNVGAGRMKNYQKFEKDKINSFNVTYDYTSIMHYGKTAFSKDDVSTTMITKDPRFQEIIGTTSKVSFKDAKIANAMYKCADHCPRKPFCDDGYVDKNCRCVCPDGTQSCSQSRVPVKTHRNVVYPHHNNGQARRQGQTWRVIPSRRQYLRQREFPTRRSERRLIIPSKPYEPRQQVVVTRPYEPRRVFPHIRNTPRQRVTDIKRQEPTRFIQIRRQEPRRLIQIRRQEPNRVFQIRRQEPLRIIRLRPYEPARETQIRPHERKRVIQIRPFEPKPEIHIRPRGPTRNIRLRPYEPQREFQVRPLEPARDIQVRPLEPARDIQVEPFEPKRPFLSRKEQLRRVNYKSRQEQGQVSETRTRETGQVGTPRTQEPGQVGTPRTQEPGQVGTTGTQESGGQSTGHHQDQLDPYNQLPYITDPYRVETFGDTMTYLMNLLDAHVRKKRSQN